MADFTVGKHDYKSRKMDAFKQLHIARRIAPLFGSLGDAYKKFSASDKKDPLVILEPVSQAISSLRDADVDYIINNCLAVCQRNSSPNAGTAVWSNVMSSGGLQFEDIEMAEMIQIVWYVVQENLGRFMAALPAELKDKLAPAEATA